MVNAHRQAWTWQDEWYGLTMSEIRALEAETAKALAAKMGECDQNGAASEAALPSSSNAATPTLSSVSPANGIAMQTGLTSAVSCAHCSRVYVVIRAPSVGNSCLFTWKTLLYFYSLLNQ